jgi:Mitosis protein DIM1
MSYLLPHLHSGWAVDQAILAEEERLVIIRFGHDWDETCMQVLLTFLLPDPFVIIVNLFILAYGVGSNLDKLRIWFH